MGQDFNIKQTIFSGQCFRFSYENNAFTIYSGVGKNVKSITVPECLSEEILHTLPIFWLNYFDMNFNYALVKSNLSKISDVMKTAINYAPGIHILNQDRWEALCSFVISQNNNIKRIKKIISKLCDAYGDVNFDGIHGFPTPEKLAYLSEEELRNVGLGFRANYIINTAKAVINNDINFSYLEKADLNSAIKMLTNVKGIGPKVANCTLLFGFHRLDCFPLDTWMKKVMQTYFPNQTPEIFGPYAGIAQQYLFHWIRKGEV